MVTVCKHWPHPQADQVGCTFATIEGMRVLARKAGFTLRSEPADAGMTLLALDPSAG